MEKMILYHTGFQEIHNPNIHIGRRNADFGQGFYLSANREFSQRWARTRRGEATWLNTYELIPNGLKIKRLERDAEWYDYVFHNRTGYDDSLLDYDVIIGPIANDTIYDTWGISTSGMLNREQSLKLLTLGPIYEQTVLKTEKAVEKLRFVSAQVIPEEEIARYREKVREEETEFQSLFSKALEELLKD